MPAIRPSSLIPTGSSSCHPAGVRQSVREPCLAHRGTRRVDVVGDAELSTETAQRRERPGLVPPRETQRVEHNRPEAATDDLPPVVDRVRAAVSSVEQREELEASIPSRRPCEIPADDRADDRPAVVDVSRPQAAEHAEIAETGLVVHEIAARIRSENDAAVADRDPEGRLPVELAEIDPLPVADDERLRGAVGPAPRPENLAARVDVGNGRDGAGRADDLLDDVARGTCRGGAAAERGHDTAAEKKATEQAS